MSERMTEGPFWRITETNILCEVEDDNVEVVIADDVDSEQARQRIVLQIEMPAPQSLSLARIQAAVIAKAIEILNVELRRLNMRIGREGQ